MWDYDDADKDADQWLYLPAVGKVKRIASAEKGDNFMGSDFTYRDMEGRDPDDYDQTIIGKEVYDGDSCWVIESTPIEGTDDDYIRMKSWIVDETWVMRKAEFYDKKDELRKQLDTYDVELIDEIWTVKKMVMKDVKKKHQTEILVEDVEYNSGVPEENFTKRALQRGEIVR
jgi:outer membrane lipoprotein-sorting protein